MPFEAHEHHKPGCGVCVHARWGFLYDWGLVTVNTTVTVRVPAKVNLQLAVGPRREDGFHDLVNVFHAVSLFDEVTVKDASVRRSHALTELTADGDLGSHLARVPLDPSNLAARAAELLAETTGHGTPVDMHLAKYIPVAGGMAGGSADAAAALVACDRLWGTGLPRRELLELAARLGSDVAFGLVGHTAVGTGRGEFLTPMTTTGRFRWVFALSPHGLSTGAVFGEYDRLRPDAPEPEESPALRAALTSGDPVALGAALSNDLQPAALSLLPELERTLKVGGAAGALGALVSGSGPTCAFLVGGEAEDPEVLDAREAEVIAALEGSGLCERVVTAHGDVPGATVL